MELELPELQEMVATVAAAIQKPAARSPETAIMAVIAVGEIAVKLAKRMVARPHVEVGIAIVAIIIAVSR